jgi:hypothetical protein
MGSIIQVPFVAATGSREISCVSPENTASTILGKLPTFFFIEGPLCEGRELARPLLVEIVEEDREEGEDREFLVSEPKYHMHGAGKTIPDAIATFKRIFSGYLDILAEEEDHLSVNLQEQLKFLRSMIRIS